MIGKHRTQINAAAIVVVTWISIGTIVFHSLEKWTWIQAIYFSTATLTTVGYGDLHPTSDTTRLVDVFYILFGVAAVVSAVSVLGNRRIEKKTEKLEERANKK